MRAAGDSICCNVQLYYRLQRATAAIPKVGGRSSAKGSIVNRRKLLGCDTVQRVNFNARSVYRTKPSRKLTNKKN